MRDDRTSLWLATELQCLAGAAFMSYSDTISMDKIQRVCDQWNPLWLAILVLVIWRFGNWSSPSLPSCPPPPRLPSWPHPPSAFSALLMPTRTIVLSASNNIQALRTQLALLLLLLWNHRPVFFVRLDLPLRLAPPTEVAHITPNRQTVDTAWAFTIPAAQLLWGSLTCDTTRLVCATLLLPALDPAILAIPLGGHVIRVSNLNPILAFTSSTILEWSDVVCHSSSSLLSLTSQGARKAVW
eukprot:m.335743 g.335743  ORF g.335743 m.335743 type:complete len:241 (+) comp16529_c0_seq89:1947-2669(+)